MRYFRIPLLILLAAWTCLAQQADRFAAIALEAPPPQRARLAEKLPPKLPAIDLKSSRTNPAVVFPRRHVMSTKAEFRAAMAELKRKYQPFLEDRTPAGPVTRAKVPLDTFDFRMEEPADLQDIGRVFRGEGKWDPVRIPDYRGPIGWWAGYYRKVLAIPDNIWKHEAVFVRFGAVDYRCQVYLNGRMVGAHTGYFAPFEIDITPYLRRSGENVLVVRIENDSPMLGLDSWRGPKVDGDKIFAAVGPGWDEAVKGWHACPPGAGIWQKVYLEGRPKLNITGIFVRPDLDNSSIEARVEVYQPEKLNRPIELSLSIYPKNFDGPPFETISVPAGPAGPGMSEYRAQIRMSGFRKWGPEAPYLYTLRVTLRPKDGGPQDTLDGHFGMRKFTMDDSSELKGTLYLNDEPVILRGANTMGHFMRAAMEGKSEQLIEDILIAKVAHMNYFRLTQSPVQPEVYDMCDRLGMMVQTDLPLFGYLRRSNLEEAIKQSGEMEKLIRSHPSNIMISYINEPSPAERANQGHRQVTRAELELFFNAASALVRAYNPDRVIKPVDGDYDPPTWGIPDNHIYSTWYGSHAVPIGKFIRGYWVPQKDGWKFGSGEYGVEGLEDAETMFKHYPKEWLPKSVDDKWNPDKIAFAQAWNMHPGWFDAQDTMREWIEASQRHQAWGVRTQTRAFRRQTNRFVSTAVHLLIDAWPAGWMKTLVDVDRNPKPSFFEYREALTPLMVDIRTDRNRYSSNEKLQLEFWVVNDRAASFPRGTLVWEVLRGEERLFVQSTEVEIPSSTSAFQGHFRFPAPPVSARQRLTVRLGLKDPAGNLVHDSQCEVEVFPVFDKLRNRGKIAAIVGRKDGRAWRLAQQLGLEPQLFAPRLKSGIVLVDSVDAYELVRSEVLEQARSGGTVVLLEQEPGSVWHVLDQQVRVARMPGKEFVSRKTGHPLIKNFQPFDFSYWYDREKDYIEYVATSSLNGGNLKPILISGENARAGDPYPVKRTLIVAGEMTVGKGSLLFTQLKAISRLETEPVAAAYFQALVDWGLRVKASD